MNSFHLKGIVVLILLTLSSGACVERSRSEGSGKENTSEESAGKGVNPAINTAKKTAVAVVHSSAVGLGQILKAIPDSGRRVATIRTFIDSIRFYDDKSGYFYVYNFNCFNIAHATQKDLLGKDLYDYTDVKGKYVIRELSLTAAKGGGFVQFHWVKPGETGEKLKIGYVEPIPGTDFFIGSGVYLPE